MNTEQARARLLAGNEISVAVEGRFTNLRIWLSNAPGLPGRTPLTHIYMRLDRANMYSVPFSMRTLNYLEKAPAWTESLVSYGFTSPIEKLDEVLDLIKDAEPRECISW